MTKKDYFNEIIDVLSGLEGYDHLVNFAKEQIDALDKKAAKAKEKAAEKKASDPLVDLVAGALTNELAVVDEIAARIDNPDVTVAKVRYRLKKLIDDGVAVKENIRVDKRSLVAYRLA